MRLSDGRDVTDLEFAQDTSLWPNYPILPLKKWGDGGRELGMLAEIPVRRDMMDVLPIVFLGNFADGRSVRERERKVYSSLEKVFDDGWIVD